jgi:hypothetical protein
MLYQPDLLWRVPVTFETTAHIQTVQQKQTRENSMRANNRPGIWRIRSKFSGITAIRPYIAAAGTPLASFSLSFVFFRRFLLLLFANYQLNDPNLGKS